MADMHEFALSLYIDLLVSVISVAYIIATGIYYYKNENYSIREPLAILFFIVVSLLSVFSVYFFSAGIYIGDFVKYSLIPLIPILIYLGIFYITRNIFLISNSKHRIIFFLVVSLMLLLIAIIVYRWHNYIHFHV